MQKIENKKIKEKIYIEKLRNGLNIIVIPKKQINKKCFILGVKYGSNDNCYTTSNKKTINIMPDRYSTFFRT